LALKARTISLGSLDFLEQTLEPTKRRGVTANPEELDTAEGSAVARPLAVPDIFENGGERSDT
jgi:hypothetical protein